MKKLNYQLYELGGGTQENLDNNNLYIDGVVINGRIQSINAIYFINTDGNMETLTTAPVQSDWNETNTDSLAYIKNVPSWINNAVVDLSEYEIGDIISDEVAESCRCALGIIHPSFSYYDTKGFVPKFDPVRSLSSTIVDGAFSIFGWLKESGGAIDTCELLYIYYDDTKGQQEGYYLGYYSQ